MQKADKFQITDGGVLVRQVDFSWELSTSFSSGLVLSEPAAPLPSFSDPHRPHPSQDLSLGGVAPGTTPTSVFSFKLSNVFEDILA